VVLPRKPRIDLRRNRDDSDCSANSLQLLAIRVNTDRNLTRINALTLNLEEMCSCEVKVQGEPCSCNRQGRLWYIEDGYDSVGMRQYADIGLEEDRGGRYSRAGWKMTEENVEKQ
jgi:hypothetical protein